MKHPQVSYSFEKHLHRASHSSELPKTDQDFSATKRTIIKKKLCLVRAEI